MSSLKNIKFLLFICSIIIFLLSYSNILYSSSQTLKEDEILLYLENNPEKIDKFIKSAEKLLNENISTIQKNIIEQNLIFFEKQEFYAGNPKGKKVIYEFFDYNCGFCKKVFSDLMELISEDNEIKVVFIELPVLGQSSLLASNAAYVAHKSGKYFEMHQQLINHRGMIDINDIKLFAKQSNVNSDLLIKNINEVDISFIEKNYLIAEKLKINGTPTFIIGDEVIQGAIDKATLKSLLSVY